MVNGVIMDHGVNAVRSVPRLEIELVLVQNQLMVEINV